MESRGSYLLAMLHVVAKGRAPLVEIVSVGLAAHTGKALTAEQLVLMGAVYFRPKDSLAKPVRIMNPSMQVGVEDLVRIHPWPRRYEVEEVDWEKTILFEDESCVAIDKPAGIPCSHAVDNAFENVLKTLERRGEGSSKLYLPHRLDTDTSGILLLGKTKEFTAKVGALLQKRAVTKHYRALIASEEEVMEGSSGPLKEGQNLIHHLLPSSRSPKIFNTHPYTPPGQELPSSQECLSRVVALSPTFHLPASSWLARASASTSEQKQQDKDEDKDKLIRAVGAWVSRLARQGQGQTGLTLQQVLLELGTGRTHQARGQLSNLGSGCHSSYHIAGDNNYAGATSLSADVVDSYRSSPHLALQSALMSVPLKAYPGGKLELRLESAWWAPLLINLR